MGIEFKIKVSKIGNSLRITIPKQVAEYMEIEEGDYVGVSVEGEKTIVRKIKET